jgi:2-dehydropantoate 2-reductase
MTVLARGARLEEIRAHGLVTEDLITGHRTTTAVQVTDALGPNDRYDLVLITVRRDQLTSVGPMLAQNTVVPTMLFMLNNPIGTADLVRSMGENRVLLGFPGIGGIRDGSVVHYAMIAQQPTTLGEVNGDLTARLRALASAFRAAGLPTAVSRDMDGWLKTHAIFVTAVCSAIYQADGDCGRLARDDATLALMVRGVREGFTALRAAGVTVTPFPLRVLFTWLPPFWAVAYWRRFFSNRTAEYVFGGHARHAAGEMRILANDCLTLIDRSGVRAPALRKLFETIDQSHTFHWNATVRSR